MSIVEDKILYHISKEKLWAVGTQVSIGKTYNPFWQYYVDFSPEFMLNENKYLLCEILNTRYPSPKPPIGEETIEVIYNRLLDISKDFSLYIREQTFESVRMRYYSELPSRQKCLWLTDENNTDYWKGQVLTGEGYLYTLKVSGNLFCGDNIWLHADTFSASIYEDRAKKYWSGETEQNPNLEYIFCGEATVLDLQSIKV